MQDLPGGKSIPWLIRELVQSGPVSSTDVSEAAGVTRQAAHYHLRRMTEAAELEAVGAGRGRRYVLRTRWARNFDIAGLEKHLVWQQLQEEQSDVADLPDRASGIARFAFTEMLNNAIDHSGAQTVAASVVVENALTFFISDEGIGAFELVRRTKGLPDHVAAMQEIAKGKLTTDPERHTGQGIFFTSKAVDLFALTSNGWRWTVDNMRDDQTIASVSSQLGTQVRFTIDPATTGSLSEVFGEYTDPETLAFDTTRTVVRLFEYGVSFVSRSEAKRLTRNLEQFREVVVDFRGIEQIGQGFADEIFRVWQREHPRISLVPVKMNPAVRMLVEQARSRAW